jgi:hypothetical protein
MRSRGWKFYPGSDPVLRRDKCRTYVGYYTAMRRGRGGVAASPTAAKKGRRKQIRVVDFIVPDVRGRGGILGHSARPRRRKCIANLGAVCVPADNSITMCRTVGPMYTHNIFQPRGPKRSLRIRLFHLLEMHLVFLSFSFYLIDADGWDWSYAVMPSLPDMELMNRERNICRVATINDDCDGDFTNLTSPKDIPWFCSSFMKMKGRI